MELPKEILKAIADKSNELDLGQLDKYILCDAARCAVFDGTSSIYVTKALQKAYDNMRPGIEGCSGRSNARTWSTIMELALIELLKNPRTVKQKEIDAWIAEHVSTNALDKFIKERLADCPVFRKYDNLGVAEAIELAYCKIVPEEDYDPWIWTTIVEKALVVLEPHKDKLFRIEFVDYTDYIKEFVVGYNWIKAHLDDELEQKCLGLLIHDSIHKNISDIMDYPEKDDEGVPCVITRLC